MVRIIFNEKKILNREEIIYEEWVPVGKVVKIIIISVFLLISFIGIIITAFFPEELSFMGIIFGTVSIFILLLYLNFRGLQITLTQYLLEVSYGIFNHKKISLREIIRCEETKANFRRYGGIGIRVGWDGSVAYNTDFGEAVRVTRQKGRPFVFSSRYPQKICNLITKFSNQ